MQIKRSDFVWGGSAAALIGYEVRKVRQDDLEGTLSHFARRIFRTNTGLDRFVFLGAWYGFAGWLGWHIAVESQLKKESGNVRIHLRNHLHSRGIRSEPGMG